MRRKVLVLVLVFCFIFAGTALAHPFNIHPEARRPSDSEIDSFLEAHKSNEWEVYGIQYYDDDNWEWRFCVVALPVDAPEEYKVTILGYSDTNRIIVGSTYSGVSFEFHVLWSNGTVDTRTRSISFEHRKSKGDYSVVEWDPTSPLQMAMEGATEIMTNPVRQLAPAAMSLAVGLVGFAKGWTWLRKQLWGA